MTTTTEDSQLAFRGYVVAVMDVLGQKEAIRKLASFDGTVSMRDTILKALKDSIGERNGVGKIFRDSFGVFGKTSSHPALPSLTPEQREVFDRFKQFQIKTYSFSDTFVAHFPLLTKFSDPSVHDLYAMLCATAMTMQICIAAKTPVRGGIEIGWGIEWDDDEIYGPAFLHAYEQCENVAQHPRVVVGKELVSYLRGLCQENPTTPLGQIQAGLAKTCEKLLTRDDDGVFVVDYLGPGALDILGKENSALLITEGLAFVRREHERFAAAGNCKLAARYASLRRYYEAHAPRWL